MKEPERPHNVPKQAEWNPHEKQWELGNYHPSGTRCGTWRHWWHETGHLCAESEYSVEFLETYKRYHPDGTLSQQVSLDRGAAQGIYHLRKSKSETTELALTDKPNVFRAQVHYHGGEEYMAEYFADDDTRIDLDGAPLVEPSEFFARVGMDLPRLLANLLLFEYSAGARTYSQSFYLADAVLKQGLFGFGEDEAGTTYALWQVGALAESPVVALHGDHACVVSSTLSEFVSLLCYDSTPLITTEPEYGQDRKRKGYRKSRNATQFRNFAQGCAGAAPIVNIRTARKRINTANERFGREFREFWTDD